ncbi:MAG TPA: terminase family protein [Croceibacterium sp.]|jgi:hypothetical protein
MESRKLADELIALDPHERRRQLKTLGQEARRRLRPYWRVWALDGQLTPGGAWHTWVIMAGRGYGKTRAGAEWVREVAEGDPTARIALVGDSLGEARRVMVEGPSGLLAIARPKLRPAFEPSKRQLTWPGGAVATLYSAGEPESLRGPQHSHAFRASPEGVLRQRSPRPYRRAVARGMRGRSGRPAGHARRRPGMACCRQRDRSLGRKGWQAGVLPGGELAVRSAERRNAAL